MEQNNKELQRLEEIVGVIENNGLKLDNEVWTPTYEMLESIIRYGIQLNIITGEINEDGSVDVTPENIDFDEFEMALNSIRTLFESFTTMRRDYDIIVSENLALKEKVKNLEEEKEKLSKKAPPKKRATGTRKTTTTTRRKPTRNRKPDTQNTSTEDKN
tara:strand:+ start:32 stop:508 length:477 start_codon:yes stop_codon:yes gene_type:complete